MDEDHPLTTFLTERLQPLGLDPETYGPYLLPFFTPDETETDDDEWESVLELLQSSSESHSDNESVWKKLRVDIDAAWKEHQGKATEETRRIHEEIEETLQKELEQDKLKAVAAAEEARNRKAEATPEVDDEAKRALVARFGYDEDGDEDMRGGKEKQKSEPSSEPVSNRDVAAQASQERARELRSQKTLSKKDEQAKTAQAKKDKIRLKEERRKKATKGERKR